MKRFMYVVYKDGNAVACVLNTNELLADGGILLFGISVAPADMVKMNSAEGWITSRGTFHGRFVVVDVIASPLKDVL